MKKWLEKKEKHTEAHFITTFQSTSWRQKKKGATATFFPLLLTLAKVKIRKKQKTQQKKFKNSKKKKEKKRSENVRICRLIRFVVIA